MEEIIIEQTDPYVELKDVIKTNTPTPTHVPKKFTDCFYANASGLWVYVNNTWSLLNNTELSGTSLPTASANTGKYYYLTTTDTLYRSNGTAWIALN